MPQAPREPVSSPTDAARPGSTLLSEGALQTWLFDSGLCDEAGQVLSWLNPAKPGYVYPEIMGYYASLCAVLARAQQSAEWLARGQLVGRATVAALSTAGGLGRAGIDYTFDTGIGLMGLARVDQVAGRSDFKDAIARMRDFLVVGLGAQVVAYRDGKPLIDDTSWSLSYGASALKTSLALELAASILGDEGTRSLARSNVRDVVAGCYREHSFRINGLRPWVYAHAHCYAVEGLLALSARGLADPAPIRPAAEWLAGVQNADGSISNWHGRPDAELGHQGDATSQAVRIWSAVDRPAFLANIARASAFLAALQTPAGGLRYNQASADVNSWVSMFAAQAIQWARGPAEVEWVL